MQAYGFPIKGFTEIRVRLMKKKIQEMRKTLNRSIFVGERLEKNLQDLEHVSYFFVALGVVMLLLNIVKRDYEIAIGLSLFVLASVADTYFLKVKRSRRFSLIFTCVICILLLSYCVLVVDNGFAYLWTLMVPLSVCYLYGVKEGMCLTAYFQILIIIAFYTPIRQRLEGHYSTIVMDRFPIFYFFNALITGFVMYLYHKSTLFEIDHANQLNAEVERQTKVAVEQAKVAQEQSRIANERADQLQTLSEEMVETLARTIDAKDRYTNGHSFRVSEYAVALARKLGWSEEEMRELEREGLLHDIGKIGVPDAVLNKPGRLTDEEYRVIKSHTTVGKTILEGLAGMKAAAEVATYHHERYDGKGYPEGLKDKSIPKHARVISIADAYDAMHSDRIYRKALPDNVILEELKRGCGQQFDPDYLPVFLEMLEEKAL